MAMRKLWSMIFRPILKTVEKRQVTFEEMLVSLPKWSIRDKKPFSKPKNKRATWVQLVAFSRTRPPVACWAEYDGVSVSVEDMYFPAPHDIRGEIFPYDADKGIPLLDNSNEYNDMSYWNKLVERVKNMYFTLGLVTGTGDFNKNMGLLVLLVVGVGIIGIANIYFTWQLANQMELANAQIGNVTAAVTNYINTHGSIIIGK